MTERARLRSLRPGFMAATIVFALAATPAVGWMIESFYDAREASAAELAAADEGARHEMLELGWAPLTSELARRLKETHGVELLVAERSFSIELANGALRGRAAERAGDAAALVAFELSRYPPEFLSAARLRRVLLCSALSEGDVVIPSLPNFHRTLLLDVNAEPAYLRRLVHHEVFHFADYADDDQVQHDPAWAALNDRWFVYGSGGRFARDPAASAKAERPGFVTRYAESAIEEDKAETFAFTMVEPRWIAARSKADPILAHKVAAAKAQLARLSPSLDDRFWASQPR